MNPVPGAFWKRARKILLAVLPAFLMIAVLFAGNARTGENPSREDPAGQKKPLLAMGKLIVANEEMRDPRFAGTIILLLDHSELGSAGLIINRPARTSLGAAIPGIKGFKGRRDPVFYGGANRPDRAMALVKSGKAPYRSLKVFDGVYIGSGKKFFDSLMGNLAPEDVFRVYSGYVKWDYHELDVQVSKGLWTVMEGRAGIVFAKEPKTLWHRLAH